MLKGAQRLARKNGVHERCCSVAYLSRIAVALLWLAVCGFVNAFSSVRLCHAPGH